MKTGQVTIDAEVEPVSGVEHRALHLRLTHALELRQVGKLSAEDALLLVVAPSPKLRAASLKAMAS